MENTVKVLNTKIEARCYFLNDFVKSAKLLPFEDIKPNGFVRELSYTAIQEFVNIKTILKSK